MYIYIYIMSLGTQLGRQTVTMEFKILSILWVQIIYIKHISYSYHLWFLYELYEKPEIHNKLLRNKNIFNIKRGFNSRGDTHIAIITVYTPLAVITVAHFKDRHNISQCTCLPPLHINLISILLLFMLGCSMKLTFWNES